MRFEGTIKSWNDERGFGFIESTQGGDPVFVHVKALAPHAGRPQINQRVSFEIELGPQGKKRARNVEPARTARPSRLVRRSKEAPAQWGTATRFAIPAFLLLYAVVAVLWKPPIWMAAFYVSVSIITFLTYAIDKSAAQSGGWRTSESTLHTLAIAGGWPGALLAQQVLRHKSAKAEFRAVFWVTVVVNVAAFVLWCSPAGSALWAGR